MKQKIIAISILLVGGGIAIFIPLLKNNTIENYCFIPDEKNSLVMEKIETTPSLYLQSHPDILAAINGVYWGADDGGLQGIVSLYGDLLSTKKGSIRGYFSLTKNNEIFITEKLSTPLQDIPIVIGTHPILVLDSAVHPQAQEDRYNRSPAYRSAIGTKTGREICFAISKAPMDMTSWAHALVRAEWSGGINLDGGGVSEFAEKDKNPIRYATIQTKMILGHKQKYEK